jgi:protocatechuate 3,4-dioxygenase beta subunit
MPQRPNHRSLLERRQALAVLAAGPLAATAAAALAQGAESALPLTPAQSLGPFYPRHAAEMPRETDNDLLVVTGDRVLSRGVALYLTGRVLDRHGRALTDAEVEIWQCDANAVYHHPAGGAVDERDPHFQGYGRGTVDRDASFHFRTIRSVPYPGRTPHIHVRVQAAGRRALATQLYFAGEPGNSRDVLYRRLDDRERALITIAPHATSSSHPLARATQLSAAIDLVLA